jgi:hypothetical protein
MFCHMIEVMIFCMFLGNLAILRGFNNQRILIAKAQLKYKFNEPKIYFVVWK